MSTRAAINTFEISDPVSVFNGTGDIMSECINTVIFQPVILKKVKQDFSTSHYWHFELGNSLLLECCPVHCRMFGNFTDFY